MTPQDDLVDKLTKAVLEKLNTGAAGENADGSAGGSTAGVGGSTGGSTAGSGSGGQGGNPGAAVAGGGRSGPAQSPASGVSPELEALTAAELARYIDHTQLKPDTPREAIEKLCDEAVQWGFYAVCVNSHWTEFCAQRLQGTRVKVAAVVGFPLGAMASRAKGFEARHAAELGADEIDMVLNIGELRANHMDAVRKDIAAVVRATRPNVLTKVILETSMLTDEQKIAACELAKDVGADFVKTSTGFGGGGATVRDIALMRRTVGPKMGVKASGGVRTRADTLAMIQAGATRIGTSSGIAIVTGGTGSGY